MAYKSKEKFLERDGKTMSYCHVDPKLGKSCSAHIHPSDLDLTKSDAKRLRALGEELISIADSATIEEKLTDIRPEDIYTVLGMPQAKPKTQEEANKFLDDQTVFIETSVTERTEDGSWLAPSPQFGNPECNCGLPLELRELKDGRRVWHHVNHAELDSYTGFYDEDNSFHHHDTIAYNPNHWDEHDVAIIELNAGVGTRYWDQTEFSFAPISATEYYDGKDVGPSWNWEPETEARRYGTNHPTIPAENCKKCGSQNLEFKTLRSGLLNLVKDSKQTLMCNNCGSKVRNFN